MNLNAPADTLRLLREYLQALPYDEAALCERLQVVSIPRAMELTPRAEPGPMRDALDALSALFLRGEALPESTIAAHLPAGVRAALASAGLLDGGAARLMLYPAAGLLLVSDRWNGVPGRDFQPTCDIVYPAATPNTARFLRLLPEAPCETYLELCSGAAPAALAAAARYAAHAWAVDITERSTVFAEFNRRLNGIENATILCGDMYAPVAGLRFDRIVCHPPYVPATETRDIFKDAGEIGEFLTRRSVEGLAEHLNPGGMFCCLTLGVDRAKESWEERLRRWLGPAQAEFDLLLLVVDLHAPEKMAADLWNKGGYTREQRDALIEQARAEGLETFLYAHIFLQRKAAGRAPFTERRMSAPGCGRQDAAWFLNLRTALAAPGAAAAWLDTKPRAAHEISCKTEHTLRDGRLFFKEFELHAERPFDSTLGVEPWVGELLRHCDGSRSVRELHAEAVNRKMLAPDAAAADTGALFQALALGGFVEVAEFSLPAAER